MVSHWISINIHPFEDDSCKVQRGFNHAKKKLTVNKKPIRKWVDRVLVSQFWLYFDQSDDQSRQLSVNDWKFQFTVIKIYLVASIKSDVNKFERQPLQFTTFTKSWLITTERLSSPKSESNGTQLSMGVFANNVEDNWAWQLNTTSPPPPPVMFLCIWASTLSIPSATQ